MGVALLKDSFNEKYYKDITLITEKLTKDLKEFLIEKINL